MVEQITKGIKISVETKYKGPVYRGKMHFHNFTYNITINNKSTSIVKLQERFWRIFDSLNETEYVQGPGVVGQTPTLEPNDSYTYQSFCLLKSDLGAMNGYYTMLDFDSYETFEVFIPTFQLSTPILSN